MLKSDNRLRGRREPRIVLKHGRSVREGDFMLKFVERGNEQFRLTVAVSKKVSKNAPLRNSIRRRVYEAIRKELQIKDGFYIVVMGYSQEIATMPYSELKQQLFQLFKRADLLK